MARKQKAELTDVDLRKAIWDAIYDCYLKKKSIDRKVFMTRYTARNPRKIGRIKELVDR